VNAQNELLIGSPSLRPQFSSPKPLDCLGNLAKNMYNVVNSETYAHRPIYQTEQLSPTGGLLLAVSVG
jgi:hypothetical protein